MSRPLIRIHDLASNEVIDREMNDAEFEQYQLDQEKEAAKKAEEKANAEAKKAILERIGLSADELKTILG